MTSPLSAAQRKQIASLAKGKNRRELGLFTVEGTRSVLDTLGCFDCTQLLCTATWLEQHDSALPSAVRHLITVVPASDIQRVSAMQTPQPVLAVYRLPQIKPWVPDPDQLVVALDCVQDPGNLGTIIRLCDWFGVHHILAGEGTADAFAPKVVQSTMGALARVSVHYCSLTDVLPTLTTSATPIYGMALDGDNLYDAPLTRGGVIIMGNEGRGISDEVKALLTHKLLIPSYPPDSPTVESLNVATATAITLAEFRRKAI